MANVTTHLTGNTPLQIKIYTNAVPPSPSSAAGVISFDQTTQRVGINGHWYGASQADVTTLTSKVTAMLSALTTEGLVTSTEESPGVTTYTASSITTAGTGINLGENVTSGTIKQFLTALQTEITNLSTYNITGETGTSALITVSEKTNNSQAVSATTKLSEAVTAAESAVQNVTGETGDTALISVGTKDTNNAQAISATSKLSEAVTAAESAVQNVTGETGDTALISVGTKDTNNAQAISATSKLTAAVSKAESSIQSVSLTGAGGAAILSTDSSKAVTGSIDGTKVAVGGTGTHYESSTVSAAIESLYKSYANIDKDSFVQSGKLKYGAATDVEGTYIVGTDTLPTVYSDNTHSGYSDPYIELIIKENTSSSTAESYVYIKATSLVDVYTANNQTGAVQLSISADRNITAAFNIDEASQTGSVTTGAAAPVAVTIESYVKVSDSVTVTTEDGGVTEVSVGTQSVDAAGAAKKAYDTALGSDSDAAGANTIYGVNKAAAAVLGASTDTATSATVYGAKAYADTICSWTVIDTAEGS